jgi:5-methylcytosine-specific restriction endonuclease McrA
MPGDPFYSTRQWKALRLQVLNRQRWRCLWCDASIAGHGGARVDHIRPRFSFPARALDPENVRALCPACDNRRHVEKGRTYEGGANADGWPTSPTHHWNQP